MSGRGTPPPGRDLGGPAANAVGVLLVGAGALGLLAGSGAAGLVGIGAGTVVLLLRAILGQLAEANRRLARLASALEAGQAAGPPLRPWEGEREPVATGRAYGERASR